MDNLIIMNTAYAVFSSIGKRLVMEDESVVYMFPEAGLAFFGIFDGHSGGHASSFCANRMHIIFLQCFQELSYVTSLPTRITTSLQKTFKKTNDEFVKLGRNAGTTALVTLVNNNTIWIGNCGDSRAILVKDGKLSFATTDHVPANAEELHRIRESGGYVVDANGCLRVNGTLAMSRSIGDNTLKNSGVICTPDVYTFERKSKSNDYLIMVSDGMLERLKEPSSASLVAMINTYVNIGLNNGVPRSAALSYGAEMALQMCEGANTQDNMTIVIIDLQMP